ncbi:MAG: hypothetical protein AAB923_02205, partial [Patescibacteria group bacterium]
MKAWKPLAKAFYFDSFRVEPATGRVVFTYSTDAGHAFESEFIFGSGSVLKKRDFAPALLALGLAALPSYWKGILAPEIIVRAGRLTPQQVAFWQNLYIKGLGEFFYVNAIDFRDLFRVTSDVSAPEMPAIPSKLIARALVPCGGGKDSLVTGELLTAGGKPFSWFELNPRPFSARLREVSGQTSAVTVGGDREKNLAKIKELVAKGAPTGHVPISAVYMAAAVVAAKAHGYADIVLSLERSASVGNVEYLGESINHQYSKSLEFERMMREYVVRFVDPGLRLFSILRPLYELQVVREFAKHPKYFSHFISCNKGLATSAWCGVCAKCAFMYLALSAFLPPETVFGIFKKNLFEDASLIPLFEELIGMHKAKPFECVGTFEENLLALYLAEEEHAKRGIPLPPVLAKLPWQDGKKHLGLL